MTLGLGIIATSMVMQTNLILMGQVLLREELKKRISTEAALKGLDINLYCPNGIFDKGNGSWCFIEDMK